jgi:hypothetical protein
MASLCRESELTGGLLAYGYPSVVSGTLIQLFVHEQFNISDRTLAENDFEGSVNSVRASFESIISRIE